MSRMFRSYNMNQPMLFAPDVREWLPSEHLAYFISDVVESMPLKEIYESYQSRHSRGAPPIDPRLLLKLIIYGYCSGTRSSRRIEKATYENVAFRVLACDEHPDHDSIASFRSRHIKALSQIFVDVLKLCQKAGLVKMGHVSLDGTKIKANANKSKSRHFEDLKKSEAELEKEVSSILAEAAEIDAEEDRKYGKGKRGEEMPKHLQDRKKRLQIVQDLVAKMEEEAKEKRREYAKEKAKKKTEDDAWMEESGTKIERRPPKNPTDKPTEEVITARRNPTDYDSCIMKESQTGGYIQGYNCQAAVDDKSQIILAVEVENQPNDKQLAPGMMEKVQANTGVLPTFLTADNGYFSERDIVTLEKMGIDPYIPPTEKGEGKRKINASGGTRTITTFMRDKLESKTGASIYKLRKSTVEPVFGQIKEAKGFRSFLLRGLEKVRGEWELMALSHNLMKLHGSFAMS
jgi:transposase